MKQNMYTHYSRVFTLNFSFSYDEPSLNKWSFAFSSEVHFWKGVETPAVETPGKEGNQIKNRTPYSQLKIQYGKKKNRSSLPVPKSKRLYQYKALRVSTYFQPIKENNKRNYIHGRLIPGWIIPWIMTG